MSDWDDDDFEVDVKQLDEKKEVIVEDVGDVIPEEVNVSKSQASKPVKAKTKTKDAFKTFAADMDRELTEKEIQELQRQSDLSFAKDLFGTSGDEPPTPYSDITTFEEFRTFGVETGQKLATRSNATHYVDMLTALLKVALEKLDASKTRQISTLVKIIADEKSAAEKVEKKTKAKGASAKPTMKISQKSNVKVNRDEIFEDYVEDELDEYDPRMW